LIAESDIWEKKKDTKEVVAEFKRRLSVKVRQQEKLNTVKEGDFRKGELPRKYMAKMGEIMGSSKEST